MTPTIGDVILWLACLVVVAAVVRKLWPTLRRIVHTFDLIEGLPGRLDSIDKQLADVVHEVTHNDGSSIKDAVRRIERQFEQHLTAGRAETDAMWRVMGGQRPDDN